MRTKTLIAALAVLALVAAACGDDSDSEPASPAAPPEAPAPAPEPPPEPPPAPPETPAEEPAAPAEEPAEMMAAIDIDAALAADLGDCAPAPTGDPIRVGMAMDFGEVSGFADIPGSEAVKHLADLINCTGGVNGSPIEVSVQDIQGDPQVTARATQDLLDFGAHFLIGPPFADFGQPVLQVTEGRVPVFFAASTEPSLPDTGALSFLVTFDDTQQASAAASVALDQGITRAVTFSSPGPYFGYNPDVFAEVFQAGGGELVSVQSYVPIEDVDFSAQVNELAGLLDGTEAVYSAMLAFQLTALRGQLEGQGFDGLTYMSTDAFEATGGLFEENTEGIIHTTHAFLAPGGRIERLLDSYEATTGNTLDSGTFGGLYADSMLLGIQGILDCGCTDPEQIGAAVAAIESFEGFTGEMGYAGTNGIPDKPVSVHLVVDGVDTLLASWR